jgi:aldehyde dehydrogenase (NAD+)
MRILEHFFPNRELNLQSLKSIARDISNGAVENGAVPRSQDSEGQRSSEPEDERKDTEPVVESLNALHDPLGCMMQDSMGKYRYIGTHSEIPFNAAVCGMGKESREKPPEIILPPKVGTFPPSIPPASPKLEDASYEQRLYLPPRESCDYYVSRFFQEVHCIHWFYAAEAFHSRVEATYASSHEAHSKSWICSLYSIFAIGAANSREGDASPRESPNAASYDRKTASDYISLAKQLISSIYDEADIDSIRALAILSIACENLCFRVTSYLYIGASIQMAYSLGLHRDQAPESGKLFEREQNRRIWWTLFMLDQEIASRGGSPCLIDERTLRIETPFPSEQIIYPGLYTPQSWLSTSVSLSKLKREIIQAVYPERASTTKTISFSQIAGLLSSLQKWLQSMPPHLKFDVPVPPTQKRANAVLHLQYWSATILLSRPFLLYLVLKEETMTPSKKTWFENMGKVCIDAALKSLNILQQMAVDMTLSSLTTFDSTCILRVVMIFILAFARTKLRQYQLHLERCVDLFRGMEQVAFCKIVTEEIPMRLADLGISPELENGTTGVLLDDDMIAQLWGNFDSTFMTPLQNGESLDLAFDDTSSLDMATAFDESGPFNAAADFSSFDFR